MFGPGGVLFLLAHEMRLAWRGWRAASRSRGAGSWVLYIFLAVMLGFMSFWIARGLSYVEPTIGATSVGLITAVFAVLASLMLSQALLLITEALYQRGDFDLLLSSPLPPWRILTVRMAAIAVNVALLYLLLAGAVFLWLPLFGGWAWMGMLPAVLGLALLVTAFGLLLTHGLTLVLGPRNTRVAAQVLGAIIGGAAFLAFQSPNLLPRSERAEYMERGVQALTNWFADTQSPWALPARAVLGDAGAIAIWLTACIAIYAIAVWWFGLGFARAAASNAGAGARKRRDTRVARTEGGLTRSLVRKEWRLLWRDPLLLSQILLQLIYLLPLFFVFARSMNEGEFGRAQISLFSGAFVLLSATLASSLAWLTVSAEDAPDLIAAAPIARDKAEQAKAIAAATPVAVLMLVPILGAAFIAPMAGFWLALGVGAAIISACCIAIWHQKPGSRKDFRRRRAYGSFGSAMGQAFVLMGWSAATGLAVNGWPLASIIPALIALGLLLALHESRPKPA